MASVRSINTGTPIVDSLLGMMDGFRTCMAVSGACELELFDAVAAAGGSCTASDLAKRQEWNADNTERLLNTMVALKLVKKHRDDSGQQWLYENTPSGQYLQRHADNTLWGAAMSLRRAYQGFLKLPEEVKTGKYKDVSFPAHVTFHKTPEEQSSEETTKGQGSSESHTGHGHGHGHVGHGHIPHDPQVLIDRFKMFDSTFRPHLHALVTAIDLSQFKRVVDLGGGSGAVTYELLRVYPSMKGTVFDVPPVIEMARERFLPKEGNLDVTLVAGDFVEDELPEGDLYVLGRIVHDWKTEQAKTLLAKVYAKLSQGGGLILLEKCLNDDKDGPVFAHLWDCLLVSHCGGRLRSAVEYADLLSSIGFKDTQVVKTQEICNVDVIFARKP